MADPSYPAISRYSQSIALPLKLCPETDKGLLQGKGKPVSRLPISH
jgi:hypothetical protein